MDPQVTDNSDFASPPAGYTPQGVPRVVVHPKAPEAGNTYDPSADFAPTAKTAPPVSSYDPSTDFAPGKTAPPRQTGAGEAALGGIAEGATFGLAPALEGVAAASGTPAPTTPSERASGAAAARPIIGALKLAHDKIMELTGGPSDTAAQQAYEKGRQDALENQATEFKQHPEMYMLGQLGGTLLAPIPGAGVARGGAAGARFLAGARAGGIGGAAYGAGEAISQGQSPGDVLKSAAGSGAVGLMLGGVLGTALGPRVPAGAPSPGAAAAATANRLGETIPKGLASDSRAAQSTTAAMQSLPIVGNVVKNQVEGTAEAAGRSIGQSGVQAAIDANKAAIDAGYDSVRNQIDPNLVMPMPRTQAALQRVRQRRIAARQPNPDAGLDQFDNIANQGASFNGAHRARMDAREAGDVLQPHPGYNAADYNELVRAMTGDIRGNIAHMGAMGTLGRPGTTTNARRALAAFDRAEEQFGPRAEANRLLHGLLKKGGQQADLSILGMDNATGNFSLARFVTNWNKINPDIRPFVPEAAHARNIEDIFNMGQHIKRALRDTNTSHTGNVFALFELAKSAAEMGIAVHAGAATSGAMLAGGAGLAPELILGAWLASPAHAASMARWSRAYQGLLGSRTPARVAAFNLATRNLANTLGLPVERVMEVAARRAEATFEQEPQQPERPRPADQARHH